MIVLDTHAFFWMVAETERLSPRARAAIRAESPGGLGMAAISLWELAMMIHRGRVAVSGSPEIWIDEAVRESGVALLPLTAEIVSVGVRLPPSFPKDPGDRLIAATAMVHGAKLVTKDERIENEPHLRTIW